MKRNTMLLLLTGVLALHVYGLEDRGRAVIYTSKSKVIKVDEILANFGKKWNVTIILDDGERVKSNIVINDIKRLEITKWDNEEEWWLEGKIVLRPEILAANDTVSKEYMIIANPDSLFKRDDKYIVYKKSDPVNNELVSNRIWSKSITAIEFGPDIGSFKIDSNGNKFNPDYIYSPYTGEIMKFGNSSDRENAGSTGNKLPPENQGEQLNAPEN